MKKTFNLSPFFLSFIGGIVVYYLFFQLIDQFANLSIESPLREHIWLDVRKNLFVLLISFIVFLLFVLLFFLKGRIIKHLNSEIFINFLLFGESLLGISFFHLAKSYIDVNFSAKNSFVFSAEQVIQGLIIPYVFIFLVTACILILLWKKTYGMTSITNK